ncbi:MAG: GNAT family N-acetyltransferase [Sarcina sp.]
MYLDIMNEIDAKEICGWEYEGVYSDYDMGGWKKCVESNSDITVKEKREEEFLSAFNEEKELLGFIRMTTVQSLAVLGIGLRPSLCGQGLGGSVLRLGIEKIKKLYPDKRIVLMVKPFNERGIKCYSKLGFKIINNNFVTGGEKYFIMECKN